MAIWKLLVFAGHGPLMTVKVGSATGDMWDEGELI